MDDKTSSGSRSGPKPKRRSGYRLGDATLDAVIDEWPPLPPRPPKTAADRARLALIGTPGQAHRLTWQFSDVGRASMMASQFRRAKPSKLDPAAAGTFDARAFFDTDTRKWRVAARYLPPDNNQTTPPPTPAEK